MPIACHSDKELFFNRLLLCLFSNPMSVKIAMNLSNGHSPQLRETGSLLVQMCRGKSHFFQKWPLANVGKSGESEQTRFANVGEFSESDPFSKRVILASTRICQKWQISGKYSNSINSLSSGHCLILT
jgi:hypothetical protein